MIKKINWKAIGIGFSWVITLSGLIVLMSFIEGKKAAVKCTSLKVIIPGVQSFLEKSEIDNILLSTGGPLVGRDLNKINIQRLERLLKENPFVESAKVYADMDGVVWVNVQQREPILRVLNLANQDYYIDKNGLKIPVSTNFTARVLVANGHIAEAFGRKIDSLKTNLAKDLYKTALFIQKDTLWNEQIEQLYVNEQSEIELIPRVGDHKILLGNADSLEVKFKNLLIFYKKAIPSVGWDAYKTINIKYTNQIVCERNQPDSTLVTSAPAVKPAPVPADSLKTIKQDTTIH